MRPRKCCATSRVTCETDNVQTSPTYCYCRSNICVWFHSFRTSYITPDLDHFQSNRLGIVDVFNRTRLFSTPFKTRSLLYESLRRELRLTVYRRSQVPGHWVASCPRDISRQNRKIDPFRTDFLANPEFVWAQIIFAGSYGPNASMGVLKLSKLYHWTELHIHKDSKFYVNRLHWSELQIHHWSELPMVRATNPPLYHWTELQIQDSRGTSQLSNELSTTQFG